VRLAFNALFFFLRFSLAGKDTFSIDNRFMRWSEEERTWGGVQFFWLEIREEEWPIQRITNERDSPHQRRACSSVSRCCGAVSWYYGLRAELYGTRAGITTGGFEIHRSTTSTTLSTLGKEKGQKRSYLRLNCKCDINVNNNDSGVTHRPPLLMPWPTFVPHIRVVNIRAPRWSLCRFVAGCLDFGERPRSAAVA